MGKKAKFERPRGARKMLDGSIRIGEPNRCKVGVETKCPRKWVFIDMEDGNIWIPTGKDEFHSQFESPTKSDLKCISRAVWQHGREWDGFKWVKKGKRR